MSRTITILGCGSSGGVPRVGPAGWGSCDPLEPRNRRRRCSILVRQNQNGGETTVLVDTSPDLREQLIAADVQRLDAIVFTHDHADHTHGIDDVRPLVLHQRNRILACSDAQTFASLNARFSYIFETPAGSDYPSMLADRRIASLVPFEVEGPGGMLVITPFRLIHGAMDALGLRIGKMAYTPDVSAIPDESLDQVEDLDLWIIDALRVRPHPTHFHLEEALRWIERLKPRQAVLTNLHNDLDYATLLKDLPKGVTPAYDGMVLDA
ncbi:MAG: MBL fold metallo-hydrolase [Beijerinckiaceae bacterium]